MLKEILISEGIKDTPIARNAMKGSVPYRIISEYGADNHNNGRDIVLLKSSRGKMVRDCPCTNPSYLSCGYTIIDLVEGCHLGCDYCILSSYLNNKALTINADMDSLVEELEGLQRNTHIRRRLGTGELGDSLLYEGIFGHNKALINIMNDFPLLILELKSKTLEAVNLQEYWDKKNIVWSWSMNTEYVSNLLERDCPSPSERLSLASEVARNGGKLGFHIDPVCFYKGWKEDYTLLINDIFTQVPRQSILWISLGILRFPSFNHDYSEHLYPFISNEYIKGEDRKLRLLKPFRINIYKELAKMVFDQYPDCLLYLCMESGDVWDEALLERSKEIRHRLKNGIFS